MKERDEGRQGRTCQGLVDLLCDFLEGDLGPEEGQELERHTEECPPCMAFLNTYRKTAEICRNLSPSDIPSDLKERLKRLSESRRRGR
jgi:anti-sigma factor RsiW